MIHAQLYVGESFEGIRARREAWSTGLLSRRAAVAYGGNNTFQFIRGTSRLSGR